MGLLLGLVLTLGIQEAGAQAKPAVSVKENGAPLRAACDASASVVATLMAGSPLKVRFALMGDVPCYKVAVDLDGKQVEGYLAATAIDGLDSLDQKRRAAAWITTSEAVNAARNSQPIEGLKQPAGSAPPLPASARVILAQADQLIQANQPGRALSLLEPEIKKRRDPALLAMAGVAAWRADDPRQALDYWRSRSISRPTPISRDCISKWRRNGATIRAANACTA